MIEPGSSFLAGCGFLGELACDGTRQVGLFWAEALGWPLVWDQDLETAVQSPHGGTKVAWGGPPVAPKHGRNRQRFDLTVADGDLAAEVYRLAALGATRLGSVGDGATSINSNQFTVKGFKGVMAAMSNLPELMVLEMKLPEEKELNISKRSIDVGEYEVGVRSLQFIKQNLR